MIAASTKLDQEHVKKLTDFRNGRLLAVTEKRVAILVTEYYSK